MSKIETECWETRKKHLKQFKKRAETLVNKAVELVSLCSVDLFIVIYSNELKQYIEYCNTDPSLLFFSLQNAKETLGKVKTLHNKDTSFINKPTHLRKVNHKTPPAMKKPKIFSHFDIPTEGGQVTHEESSSCDFFSSQLSTESSNPLLIKKSALQNPKRTQSTREAVSETTETAETHRLFDWLVCERNSGQEDVDYKNNCSPDWAFDCLPNDDNYR